jgi:ATP-dependent DNA helicase RecG
LYTNDEIKQKIGVIDISKGVDKSYQTNKNQFLERVGSTNRVASQTELLRLFQQAGFFHHDATGLPSTSITDLNLTKIDSYFDQYNISFSNV